MEVPLYFSCPISMELMQDPVTICTGVTYERKNIERWFFTYKKKTCPATMQTLHSFDLTPNHTLKRLILSWKDQDQDLSSLSSSSKTIQCSELVTLLKTIESAPFKVSSLKKLRSNVEEHDYIIPNLIELGGIEVLGGIILQNSTEISDFTGFRACEEAVGILYHLQLVSEDALIQLVSRPECVRAMAVMLQRGSAEARLHSVAILRKMAKIKRNWSCELDMDILKSLLELLSDEMCTKASSCALDVLIEISSSSRRNKLKAIEAGAICVLVELLPDSSQSKCEKMLFLIKMLCEIADGRSALADHGLGIAVISKKMLRVSETATKMGVKILWLVCSFQPTQMILEEMLMCGAVKKLLGLLHIIGRSSTKQKAMKIIKLHGNAWRQYPCFPSEMRDYLRVLQDSQ